MLGSTSHHPSFPHVEVKIAFYLLLWYFLTVVHNVSTKKLLINLPLPNLIASMNLLLGIPLFLPIVLIGKPKFDPRAIDLKPFVPLGLFHCLGNFATLHSLLAGSVSFVHVVKSGSISYIYLHEGWNGLLH